MLKSFSVSLFYCIVILCFAISCGGKKVTSSSDSQDANKTMESVIPEPAAQGKKMYLTLCASCHGLYGEGDGVAGKYLKPQPRNFKKESFLAGSSFVAVKNVVTNGYKNGSTGMIAWKSSFASETELDAVVHYVRFLAGLDIDKK